MMSGKSTYITGLDLGKDQDFTAIAVLEKTTVPDPETERSVRHYAVRHLERFPLGTPYTEICSRMKQLFAEEPLAGNILVMDQTGVGRPVVEMLCRSKIQAQIIPITITAGHKSTPDARGGWLVPKQELVSNLQVLLQSRRIKVAPALPEAETLVRELSTFQAKNTAAANETFGAWREGAHDDLVLAVAIAAWIAESWVEPYTGPLVYWPVPPEPKAPQEDDLPKVIYESEDGDFAIIRVHGQEFGFDDNLLRDPWSRR